MIYATAVTSWFVTPAFADLRAGVDGGSSILAWWLDEGAEGDFTEDQMLTALEMIYRTNDATLKARAADKAHAIHKVLVDHNITASSAHDNLSPEYVRARRWIRETMGRKDFDYLTKQGLLGEIGQGLPPEDLVKHTTSQNVLFQHTGQTAPAVGFSHIKLDLSTVDLVRCQAARMFKIC